VSLKKALIAFICLVVKSAVLTLYSLSWLTVGLWDGGSYFEKYGALTDAYMPKAIP
jgi:hypothetical protein